MKKFDQINFAINDALYPIQQDHKRLSDTIKYLVLDATAIDNETKKLKTQLYTQEQKYINGKIQGYLETLQIIEEMTKQPIIKTTCLLISDNEQILMPDEKLDLFYYNNIIYINMKSIFFSEHNKIKIKTLNGCSFSLFDEEMAIDTIQFNVVIDEWTKGETNLNIQQAKLIAKQTACIEPEKIKKVFVTLDGSSNVLFENFKKNAQEKTWRVLEDRKEKVTITTFHSP